MTKLAGTVSEVEKLGKKVGEQHYEKLASYIEYEILKNRMFIDSYYNDYKSGEDKINLDEYIQLTDEELQKVDKAEKQFNSETRGYIEEQGIIHFKLLDLIESLDENDQLQKVKQSDRAYKKRLAIHHGKKGVKAGFSMAKSAYYEGLDKLEKQIDQANKEFYKEMKKKPTNKLLDYYNNAELNKNQVAIIEQILDERGAL